MNTEPLSFWYFHGVYDVSLYNTNISIFSSRTTFQLQLRCMPENFFYSLRRISLKIWQLWFYLLVLLSFNHVGRSKTRTRSEWFPQNVTWDRFPQWSPPLITTPCSGRGWQRVKILGRTTLWTPFVFCPVRDVFVFPFKQIDVDG